jgi:Ca2+/Na+ antiporter
MILQLAQTGGIGLPTELGILQTILNGGLPLALLIAVYIIFTLYKKEKEAKDSETTARVAAVTSHAKELGDLRDAYSTKVEQLLRERIESETASQKIIIETREVMQSVVMQMGTIRALIETAERGTH